MNKIFKILKKLMGIVARKVFPEQRHRMNILKVAESYDMYKRPDEDFFAELYLKYINKSINNTFKKKKIRILDAGCGQGRISIPLAKIGHNVDALDLTPETVIKGKKYAEDESVKINFMISDITSYVPKVADERYDCVICTEVLYMLSNYDEAIKGLIKSLKKGGLLILSVRPKLYNVLYQIIRNNIDRAEYVAENRDGKAINWFFNWFTKDEIADKLRSFGISNIKCYGIGVASGIEDDPQSKFVRPSVLNDKERRSLLKIELELGQIYPDSGRYILTIGKKGEEK
jgi:2-polyprenyl-3-methyl-5-hydroxy-6-metoxy-1,4-benzoquinol methylase